MESWLPLIIQLIAGLIGGNAVGAAMKDKSLGGVGNSIAGLVGGGVLGQIIQSLMAGGAATVDPATTAAGMDMGSIIASIVGGGAGGAILTAIIGMIKSRFSSAG
jgi:hypothetical protein